MSKDTIEKINAAVKKYKYSFAFWTDKADFILDKNADLAIDKLLEVRCFDESGEFHAIRTTIDADSEFSLRDITCDDSYADGYYDEAQYLDIDTTRKDEEWTYTTGGGKYHLPEDAKGKKMILVRFFYKFDNDGIAQKYDWRLVEFKNKETVGRGE